MSKKELNMRSVMIEAIINQGDSEVVKEAGAGVSNHLLELAKGFDSVGHAPTQNKEFKGDPDGFLGACYEQEQWAKSSDAGKSQVDTIPLCWTRAKASIKAAMVMGLDLSTFDSESSLRKEVAEARGLLAGEGEEPAVAGDSQFHMMISSLLASYEIANDQQKDEMEEGLLAFAQEVHTLLAVVVPEEPVAPVEDQAVTNH